MTVKSLLIAMMATICLNGGGHYRTPSGVKKFKKCNMTPPTIKHKSTDYVSFLRLFSRCLIVL